MLKFAGMTLLGTLAAITAAAPAVADYRDGLTDRFTHEPTGYRVTVKHSGSTMYLTGSHPQTGKTFKLRVTSAGRVVGEFEGRPLDYVMGAEPSPAQQVAVVSE